MAIIDDVKHILADVMQLNDGGVNLSKTTLLLGNLPEFDSMAVVSVIVALEEYYDFEIEDDEINADVFESVSTVAAFVERKLASE